MSKKGKKKPLYDSSLPVATIPIANIFPDYSIVQKELSTVFSFMEANKSIINEAILARQRLIDSATLPLRELGENLMRVASFQREIAEHVLDMQEIARKTIVNSGLLEITNTFKNLQIEAFAGLTIKSELLESFRTISNGVTEISTIKESSYLASGGIRFGIEKNTSTEFSAQIVYQSVEMIRADVQALDENMSERILNLEKKVEVSTNKQSEFMFVLENNPFPFFKIRKIDFLSNSSQFIINGAIPIKIESKTLQDYICQILFSGYKKHLTDEWDYEEIVEQLKPFLHYDEAKSVTWKKIQDTVSKINLKIASKTTKENLIYSPRTETLQLNPVYFASNN